MALLPLYVLTATVLIWGTLVVYVLGGTRARSGLGQARGWVIEHIETPAFVIALVFGLLFTGQAVVELLA